VLGVGGGLASGCGSRRDRRLHRADLDLHFAADALSTTAVSVAGRPALHDREFWWNCALASTLPPKLAITATGAVPRVFGTLPAVYGRLPRKTPEPRWLTRRARRRFLSSPQARSCAVAAGLGVQPLETRRGSVLPIGHRRDRRGPRRMAHRPSSAPAVLVPCFGGCSDRRNDREQNGREDRGSKQDGYAVHKDSLHPPAGVPAPPFLSHGSASGVARIHRKFRHCC
jgi:hypothetical protein